MVTERVEVEGNNRLVYFAPEFTETSTIKRVQAFIDSECAPVVFGFERGRYNLDYKPEWPHVLLGRTRDGRYWHRLGALVRALPVLWRHRAILRQAKVFYARNVDLLALALLVTKFFNRNVFVVYEILDVQPVMVRRGFRSALMRLLERLCLKRIGLLVVSSPGFFHNYYSARQGYRGEWFLLENKLHSSALEMTEPQRPIALQASARQPPWVVGYFGLIRGKATIELILRVAEAARGRVIFQFRGVLTTVDEQQFRTVLRRADNVVYGGEYANPRDLPGLYRSIDFAWALDLENIANNSRWLLPCRFYEAGLFGVPCLAVREFELGHLITRLDIGWTFTDPLEDSLTAFFKNLTVEEYRRKRRRLAELPRDAFIGDADAKAFCTLINERTRPACPRRLGMQPGPYTKTAPSPIGDSEINPQHPL